MAPKRFLLPPYPLIFYFGRSRENPIRIPQPKTRPKWTFAKSTVSGIELCPTARHRMPRTLSPEEAIRYGRDERVREKHHWLIVVAFFISRGFIKTGLGSRIA